MMIFLKIEMVILFSKTLFVSELEIAKRPDIIVLNRKQEWLIISGENKTRFIGRRSRHLSYQGRNSGRVFLRRHVRGSLGSLESGRRSVGVKRYPGRPRLTAAHSLLDNVLPSLEPLRGRQ